MRDIQLKECMEELMAPVMLASLWPYVQARFVYGRTETRCEEEAMRPLPSMPSNVGK